MLKLTKVVGLKLGNVDPSRVREGDGQLVR
jgi:hypothetical protein